MMKLSLCVLALSSGMLLAQEKPPTGAPPIIDAAHQIKLRDANEDALKLQNAILESFGDQIKQVKKEVAEIGQELAAICGEKYSATMDGKNAVCVEKNTVQQGQPTGTPPVPKPLVVPKTTLPAK